MNTDSNSPASVILERWILLLNGDYTVSGEVHSSSGISFYNGTIT